MTLPVEASAAPLRLAIARTRPMSGEVSIQGQIQPIWDLFFGGERSLAGQVDGQRDPRPAPSPRRASTAGWTCSRAASATTPRVCAERRHPGQPVRRHDRPDRDLHAPTTARAARSSGDGRIGLREGSGSSFELALTRFRIIDNDIAEARASGPLTVVRGADGNIQLAGEIDIDEARIEANPPGSNGIVGMDVVEINRPGGDPVETERDGRAAVRSSASTSACARPAATSAWSGAA